MKKVYVFAIAFMALGCFPVFAQVDTLQLVEIGSIEASAEITNLYVEDLDGDSVKEIILTTATNIHIYNGITFEEIWISPELVNPEDLLFEDINNDSLIDLSVRDSLNITLYDPLNSAIIWTGPPLDSTYSVYTIGDRNDDDWIDVVIGFRQETISYYDSLHVDIFDGPQFDFRSEFYIRISNSESWGDDYHYIDWEEPNEIIISKMNYDGAQRNMIVLFVDYTLVTERWYENMAFYDNKYIGKVWVVDGEDLSYFWPNFLIGSILYQSCEEIDGDEYLIGLFHSLSEYITEIYFPGTVFGTRFFDIVKAVFSPDTLMGIEDLYSREDFFQNFPYWPPLEWEGLVVDDIYLQVDGKEAGLSAFDTLRLFSYPETELLWEISALVDIDTVLYVYNASNLYESPQIICQIEDPAVEYRFYSGSDGSLTAVLPEYGYPISDVVDLDFDGNDEILSIDANALHVYGLQRTGIDDGPLTPNQPYLLSNYPNPFNSATTIEYSLPEGGHVTIEIYDLLGRKVETLIEGEQPAGYHQVTWDAENYPSGLYFYRIQAGEYVETRKMVLLK